MFFLLSGALYASKEVAMEKYMPVKEGKGRGIYDQGAALVMVATERI